MQGNTNLKKDPNSRNSGREFEQKIINNMILMFSREGSYFHTDFPTGRMFLFQYMYQVIDQQDPFLYRDWDFVLKRKLKMTGKTRIIHLWGKYK